VGIKVWVLTGDKPDTSLSIAFASRLITHKFHIIDFQNNLSVENIKRIIEENLLKMKSDSNEKYALLVVSEDIELIMSDEELTDKVLIFVTNLVLRVICEMQFSYMLQSIP